MFIFKKALLYILFALVFVWGLFVSVDTIPDASNSFLSFEFGIAEAQANATTTATTGGNASDVVKQAEKNNAGLQTVVETINTILGVLSMLVTPIILMVGWLLSPDWMTGKIFNLEKPMYDLWITVSNIVYFVYAVLLIVIAVATIFNSQNYGYKAMLPRLFLGILMVPFTWWFVWFVVSLSTFATSMVLQIPYDTLAQVDTKAGWTKENFWNSPVIPKEITVDSIMDSSKMIEEKCSAPQWGTSPCVTPKDFVDKAGGIYSPLIIYAYGVFKVQDIKRIPGTDGNANIATIANMWQLVIDLLMGGIMFLIFGIIVIALAAVLFVRVVMMWIYTMFSPIFTMTFVFWNNWKDDISNFFDIKDFIATAFMPMVIGLVLSFWLIVVSAVRGGVAISANKDGQCTVEKMKTAEWCLAANIMGAANNAIIYKLENKPSASQDKNANPNANPNANAQSSDIGVDNTTGKVTADNVQLVTIVKFGDVHFRHVGTLEKDTAIDKFLSLTGWFLGILGTIFVQFISIIFIWMAFISVGRMSKWAGKALNSVASLGKQLGMSQVKSVKVPFVGSVGGAMQLPNVLREKMNSKNTDYYNDLANSGLGRMMNVTPREKPSSPAVNAAINSVTNVAIESGGVKYVRPEDASLLKTATETIHNEGHVTAAKVLNDNTLLLKTTLEDAKAKFEAEFKGQKFGRDQLERYLKESKMNITDNAALGKMLLDKLGIQDGAVQLSWIENIVRQAMKYQENMSVDDAKQNYKDAMKFTS